MLNCVNNIIPFITYLNPAGNAYHNPAGNVLGNLSMVFSVQKIS